MKICKRPEWKECAYAVDVREGEADFKLLMFLGAIECHAPGPCPFEEEDDERTFLVTKR